MFFFQYLKDRKKGKYSMISGKKIKMKVKKSKKDKQVSNQMGLFVVYRLFVWFFFSLVLCVLCFLTARQKSSRASGVLELYPVIPLWTPVLFVRPRHLSRSQEKIKAEFSEKEKMTVNWVATERQQQRCRSAGGDISVGKTRSSHTAGSWCTRCYY